MERSLAENVCTWGEVESVRDREGKQGVQQGDVIQVEAVVQDGQVKR
jgi:hypothetical protein